MSKVYGRNCLARSSVIEWIKTVKSGTATVKYASRQGQANRVISDKDLKNCTKQAH